MSVYFIIYIFCIIYSIWFWISIYSKNKNTSYLFFMLFTIFSWIWMFLYYIFLSWQMSELLAIYISRIAFYTSFLWLFSFTLFIALFSWKKNDFSKIIFLKTSLLIFVLFWVLTIFTNKIVDSLYIDINWIYRENFWELFFIYRILYIFSVPFSFYIWYLQLKKQSPINKARLKYIIIWSLIFTWFCIFFQMFLPIYWIWIFEKELIIFFLIFIISIWYSLKRYFFNSFWYWIGKIIINITSLLFCTIIIYLINIFYYYWLPGANKWYWIFNDSLWIVNIILIIFVYNYSNNLLWKLFLWNSYKSELKSLIIELQKKVSYITDYIELNKLLRSEFQKIFKTSNLEIILYKNIKKKLFKEYFEKNIYQKIFINDIVFIEENKNKFNKIEIIEEIPVDSFLIFPIFWKENENIWILCLWIKAFWDFYSEEEIKAIKNFIFFLEYHLKYINNYEKIKDFSINLDKKVDEKTIEYNNLINKQKEFISMISHEIRSPISSAVFQADSIVDEFKKWSINKNEIIKELEILNQILIKTWELSFKLFSIQYYDTNKISLYKEKIQISNLLKNEIDIYSHLNENISFIDKINPNIWYIEIDKIQFIQVIENIIWNAIKFVSKDEWIILITANVFNNEFIIEIEDNWNWFEWINISEIFDKYSRWNSWYKWLWIWLYLCKKIINMHKWEISASSSKKLWWAKFKIVIPT